MNSRTLVVVTSLVLAAATSTIVLAEGAKGAKGATDHPVVGRQVEGRQGPDKPIVERIKEHPVAARILVEVVRNAVGFGSPVGAAVGAFLTPSKIGCGAGEQCR